VSKSHPERFQAARSDQNPQGGFDQRHADDTVPLAALFADSNQGGDARCGAQTALFALSIVAGPTDDLAAPSTFVIVVSTPIWAYDGSLCPDSIRHGIVLLRHTMSSRPGEVMREIDQSVDDLRGTVSEMSRGLSLQATAERMGGFGFVTRDLETGDYWLSEGVYEIIGLRRLSALAKKSQENMMVDLVHPDDLEAVLTAAAAVTSGGAETEMFIRLVRTDGDVRNVHWTAQIVAASGDHPAIYLATVVDVTPSARTDSPDRRD
jgi:hypothetical protein